MLKTVRREVKAAWPHVKTPPWSAQAAGTEHHDWVPRSGVTDMVSGEHSVAGEQTAAFTLCAHKAPQGSVGGAHSPLLSPLVKMLSLQDQGPPCDLV